MPNTTNFSKLGDVLKQTVSPSKWCGSGKENSRQQLSTVQVENTGLSQVTAI